jgi:hypothetical protein
VRRKWRTQASQETEPPGRQDRLKRLAAGIEELAKKDEQFLRHAHEINGLRQRAAAELHKACCTFAEAVNRLLSHPELKVDPPEYLPASFNEDRINLIQINVRGRILQVTFEATPELLSTEDFRIPYTLEGSVRSFNQEWLDRNTIMEQLIFYCLEKSRYQWRYFDARTYRSGPFDQEYLVTLMEHLL